MPASLPHTNTSVAQRFWVNSSDSFPQDTEGYLALDSAKTSLRDLIQDAPLRNRLPSSHLSKTPEALSEWRELPALILLGEAGLGKSIELQRFQAVTPETDGLVRQNTDLSRISSRDDLFRDVFDSVKVRRWLEDESQILELWLDSFDECRLRLETVAQSLGDELIERWQQHARRLRIRIACRSSVWPMVLQDRLGLLWPDDKKAVQSLTLCPLRREDVTELVLEQGLGAEQWWQLMDRRNLHALASRPLTLQLLIKLAKNGEIDLTGVETTPLSRYDVFYRGCLMLCREHNRSRRASGRLGRLDENQRLEVAARFACMSVCCGRPFLRLEDRLEEGGGTDEITINDILAQDSGGDAQTPPPFRPSGEELREILDTALFEAVGVTSSEEETPQTFAFSHRTFAEFLAAWHLKQRGLEAAQIMGLLSHSVSVVPGWDEPRVVPQLAEMAAWLASTLEVVRHRILASSPRVLLLCDLTSWDGEERERLVQAILEEIQSGRNYDEWPLRRHYGRFEHPNLAAQLLPFITNRSLSVFTRRAAIDIAEVCPQGKALAATLGDIALDATDDINIRIQAAHALSEIRDTVQCQRMRTLALAPIPGDRDEELKGAALQTVWPGHATIDEILGQIHAPQHELFGAYRLFLGRFAEKIPKQDMVTVLVWCARQGQGIHYRDEMWDIRRLMGGVFDRACQVLATEQGDESSNEEPFLERLLRAFSMALAVRYLRNDLELTWKLEQKDRDGNGDEAVVGFFALSPPIRRAVVRELIPRLRIRGDVEEGLWPLFYSRELPIWLTAEDLDWCLSQAISAPSLRLQHRWSVVARMLFEGYGLETDAVAVALVESKKSSALALGVSAIKDDFRLWFDAMLLDGSDAETFRRRSRFLLEHEQENALQTAQRIREIEQWHRKNIKDVVVRLRKCEKGQPLLWWQLDIAWLSDTTQNRHFSHLYTHLTDASLWKNAKPRSKRRLLQAAEAYLKVCWPTLLRVNKPEWMTAPAFYHDIAAGYRALLLFWLEDRRRLENLDNAVLSNWASAAVWFPMQSNLVRERDNHALLEYLHQRVPAAVASAVGEMIRGKNTALQPYYGFHNLKFPWSIELQESLIQLVQEPAMQPPTIYAVLRELMLQERFAIENDLPRSQISPRSLAGSMFLAAFAKVKTSRTLTPLTGEEKLSPTEERAERLAMTMLEAAADGGWPEIWPAMQKRPRWGQSVMLAICSTVEMNHQSTFLDTLSSEQLADWFLWLQRYFSYTQDPHVSGAHFFSMREQLGQFRDELIRYLEARGNPDALKALDRIGRSIPGHWAQFVLPKVREKALTSTWLPPSPFEVARLLRSRKTRFVSSGDELLELVVESLRRAEAKLHGEIPLSFVLWNQIPERTGEQSGGVQSGGVQNQAIAASQTGIQTTKNSVMEAKAKRKKLPASYMPKDEESISNWLAAHLRDEIGGRGAVVNREVVIRPSRGQIPGQRTDIHISAVVPQAGDDTMTIRVILEVKGNWNKDLHTAMQKQLRDGYLEDNDCRHGLYVVAWFDATNWSLADYRRNKAHPKNSKMTKTSAQTEFSEQAKGLSQDWAKIEAFVLDARL